ncbi:glycosyltransferase [Ruminococcus flavefaciens]|uniref:Glycosyltransferase 2-like domain-containing protein n=1 Tax=Ruminococcus flavefaciens 007c TaxID=1341157 RepID=W7UD66_RUMFL|nr:glycosyltransferase [Ruminococcus flavefaciens]EWM53021.1 hypothetical protein RF007C_15525 [Ruminococcus flavefaciens 007c]
MVSVIIPIYNVEKYLHDCIDSVLDQTYTDLEIILVDDGSTDSCGAICDEYAEKDCRITVIHKKNAGLSDARNAGLAAASGEYIYFLDSDDYIKKNTIGELLKYAELCKADIVFFDSELVYETKNTNLKKMKHSLKYDSHSGAEILRQGLNNDDFQTSAVLNFFSADFLKKEKRQFKKGIFFEDLLFTVLSYIRSEKVFYLDRSFYIYRIRESSIMTSVPSKKHFLSLLCCISEFRKELKKCSKYQKKNALELSIVYAANAYMTLYLRLDRSERKKHRKELRYLRHVQNQITTTSTRKLWIKLWFTEVFALYKTLFDR